METVRRMGQRHSLQMLPALRKPVNPVELRQALRSQDIAITPLKSENVTLAEALKENWIEFWFQPKIDMRRRQIAGVETFARLRHPELGMLPPGTFMPTASEGDLMLLAERSVVGALGAASAFSQLGINLRLAVNVPVRALTHMPIAELVRTFGPNRQRWPGLMLDVTESQVADHYHSVTKMAPTLAAAGISLAIDDFGRGRLSLNHLKRLPFAELKLDRAFVSDCAAEPSRASVCKSVIELAHHLDCVAVAIGVETMPDLKVLTELGCDLGQGFLFGPPMPAAELVELLRERAVPASKMPPVAPAAVAPAPINAKAGPRRARWN
jgi:EAL domain-containing protein (putative c-di-GMP-specific phosphodiesterase class I)